MKVAAFQFHGSDDVKENLLATNHGIKKGSKENVRFLMTQECALCGYPPVERDKVSSMRIVFILQWFSLVAAIGLIVVVYSQWKVPTLPLWSRIHTSFVGIASIAFLWFVYRWNLFLK